MWGPRIVGAFIGLGFILGVLCAVAAVAQPAYAADDNPLAGMTYVATKVCPLRGYFFLCSTFVNDSESKEGFYTAVFALSRGNMELIAVLYSIGGKQMLIWEKKPPKIQT